MAELAETKSAVVSTQVLQEVYVNVRKKLNASSEEGRGLVEQLTRFEVVVNTAEDIHRAIDLHVMHQLSLWDGLICRFREER